MKFREGLTLVLRWVKKSLNGMHNGRQETWFFVHEVTDIIFLRYGAFITAISKIYLQQRFARMRTLFKLQGVLLCLVVLALTSPSE